MPRMTQDEKDEITAALLGVTERFGGDETIDIMVVHQQAAEVCRIIEARDQAQIALPVWTPPIYELATIVGKLGGRIA